MFIWILLILIYKYGDTRDADDVGNVNQDNERIARNDKDINGIIQKCNEITNRNDPKSCNENSDIK